MSYRFLLFDADCTLLDFPQDMTKAFHLMYAAHFAAQKPFTLELLACYEDCNNRAWTRFERGECTKQELYLSRFIDFLAETGLSGDPIEINETYFSSLAKTGTPYPGAVELVADLAETYDLYMITNGNVVSQFPRLEHAGLLPYFKEVFVSEAVGVGKPDKRYFDYVAAHIPGFTPQEALVIGDSLSSDIQGAVNAGLHSLWFHPPGLGVYDSPAPLYTWQAEDYAGIREILRHV